jgi:hypothetical protein
VLTNSPAVSKSGRCLLLLATARLMRLPPPPSQLLIETRSRVAVRVCSPAPPTIAPHRIKKPSCCSGLFSSPSHHSSSSKQEAELLFEFVLQPLPP